MSSDPNPSPSLPANPSDARGISTSGDETTYKKEVRSADQFESVHDQAAMVASRKHVSDRLAGMPNGFTKNFLIAQSCWMEFKLQKSIKANSYKGLRHFHVIQARLVTCWTTCNILLLIVAALLRPFMAYLKIELPEVAYAQLIELVKWACIVTGVAMIAHFFPVGFGKVLELMDKHKKPETPTNAD